MSNDRQIIFAPFTLDTSSRILLRGTEPISLRPKSLAVLQYLAENPHRLVTKEELIRSVWAQARVVDAALKVSVLEIRRALGDSAARPRFVETLGRNGYRFVAPVSFSLSTESGLVPVLHVVGRQAELQFLRRHLEIAGRGKRQIVFVTGEPGIGKTTLAETFAKSLATEEGMLVVQGRCIEQYGAGEAYMPILDALERMCQATRGKEAVHLLRRYAPSWLVNLPGLADPMERAELERQTIGTTPERRLREIAAFLESLAIAQTVLLVLEDLHWLDPSTLALISFLGRRQEKARLILIGTYREGEAERLNHPLKSIKEELELHHYCTHLRLKLLSRSDVGDYLGARFETQHVADKVVSTIYKRSEGNPLFMVNVTDYLIAQEAIVRENGLVALNRETDGTAPTTIGQLIHRQFEMLPREDQALLEVASVGGMVFSAAAVAAGLGKPVEEVETGCERLIEHDQFLQQSGTTKWPDGTITTQYSFIHALYQNVIYHRIGDSRRARLHQSIGDRLRVGYHGRTEELAAELALHFERAGDYPCALPFLVQSAETSISQGGYSEAISYVQRGVEILGTLPARSGRTAFALRCELALGVSLSALNGYSSQDTNRAFLRAYTLSRKVRDSRLLFRTLAGLWSFCVVRGELNKALRLGKEMIVLAERAGEPSLLVDGHMAAGMALFYLGNFTVAHKHLARCISLRKREDHNPYVSVHGWDAGIIALCYLAHAKWFLGTFVNKEPELQEALTFAKESAAPINLAIVHGLLTEHAVYHRDPNRVLEYAEPTISISTEHGFGHWLAIAMVYKGWALCKNGQLATGIREFDEGANRWTAMGAGLGQPTILMLRADIEISRQNTIKALDCIGKALKFSQETKHCYLDAELLRLRGEILIRGRKNHSKQQISETENSFCQAVQTAHRQKARLLELRATVRLARFWRRMEKKKEAYAMLAKLCAGFTKGLNAPDLIEALDLLRQLS